MIHIKTFEQLPQRNCTAKDALRIATTRKRFAVFTLESLHLVNDLNRLIYDKLRADEITEIDIYQLR